MRIAIDASNLSSGGGITHLENFLNNIDYNQKNLMRFIFGHLKTLLKEFQTNIG